MVGFLHARELINNMWSLAVCTIRRAIIRRGHRNISINPEFGPVASRSGYFLDTKPQEI